MAFFRTSLLLLIALLSGCGGGGSGGGGILPGSGGGTKTLQVALAWPNKDVNLYKDSVVMPVFFGFDGHEPVCMLTSGRLPTGMTLGSNCAIVGRPTEAGGPYNISIKVGASGVSNTVNSGVTIRVLVPGARYPSRADSLGVGAVVSDPLVIGGWEAPPDAKVSWTYGLRSGSLPPGLTMDPSNGKISGTVNQKGSFTATISATMTTQFGAYEAVANYTTNVDIPGFNYVYVRATGGVTAYVSQPFVAEVSLSATAPPGTTISNFKLTEAQLPAGLSLDPVSGRVSGTPIAPVPGRGYPVQATIVSGGLTNTTNGSFGIEIAYPLFVRHFQSQTPAGTAGTPISLSPIVKAVSPIPLVSPSYSYAQHPGSCTLPNGVSIYPATGILSGTPGSAGTFSCDVDITVTNNGMTWVQLPTQLFFTIK